MYKMTFGRGPNALTKYFLSYHEATAYAKAVGRSKRSIKPVH